mgnify:CR=1 FL=1
MIIGMNFIQNHLSVNITKTTVTFTTKCHNKVMAPLLQERAFRHLYQSTHITKCGGPILRKKIKNHEKFNRI